MKARDPDWKAKAKALDAKYQEWLKFLKTYIPKKSKHKRKWKRWDLT